LLLGAASGHRIHFDNHLRGTLQVFKIIQHNVKQAVADWMVNAVNAVNARSLAATRFPSRSLATHKLVCARRAELLSLRRLNRRVKDGLPTGHVEPQAVVDDHVSVHVSDRATGQS
jgi:hypothetical protein